VLHQGLAWALIADFLLLTYLGHQPVEPPFVFLGQMATVAFFGLMGGLCVAAWADQWLAGTLPSMRQKTTAA
jgi:quinol-cytochrome oxidoreductase complex cytochrome b subunit